MIELLLKGAWVTLQISLAGIGLGLTGGTAAAIVCCRKLGFRWVARGIGVYIYLVRGTPLFVQLLLVYFALPELLGVNFSPFWAGVITLGANSTAYLCETIRAGIDGLPVGQWDAAVTLGYSRLQALRYVIMPQAFAKVLPAIANELCTLVKDSSILMVIGVPEVTKVAKDLVARDLRPMDYYLAAAGVYLAITSVFGILAKKLERVWHVARSS